MGDKVLKIGTVHQCNCCLGSKTLHPLVSVIDLSKADLSAHTGIKFDFYTILLSECKCEDTARSAEIIKNENLKGHAAICSKAAAERYGMKVLQEGIETNKHNFTRFLVVADPWQVDELRQHHANATNKASIVFTLPHTEGSLSQVLSILSFYNINLTKIQSLPIIGREWEYQFYVDVAFNDYLRYKQSIAAITPLTKELKLLGEYAEGKSNV